MVAMVIINNIGVTMIRVMKTVALRATLTFTGNVLAKGEGNRLPCQQTMSRVVQGILLWIKIHLHLSLCVSDVADYAVYSQVLFYAAV